VYHAYGIRRHFNGRDGEIDHLVPLGLGGGSNVPATCSRRPQRHGPARTKRTASRTGCATTCARAR
jgi:hypothetical protein